MKDDWISRHQGTSESEFIRIVGMLTRGAQVPRRPGAHLG